ncbi:MAG: hypothetical protein AAF799_28175 [Myxococcota bacterium]
MRLERTILVSSVLAMGSSTGCADPCLDDGLGQVVEGVCPGAGGGSGTEGNDDATAGTADDGSGGAGSCNDGVQNGDETDVDCGGSCQDKCGGGEGCMDADDCQSNACAGNGTCEEPGDCNNGVMDGSETDVDCGGPQCDGCDDGDDCLEDGDCISQACDSRTDTCIAPSCRDGEVNGGETDVDCGGPCGATCEPGEGCVVGGDCLSMGCDAGVCNDYLTVEAAPECANFSKDPVTLVATASGGTGTYSYAWTPDDGSLATPDQAMTEASPSGIGNYTVTVDDGQTTAQDSALVVSSAPLNLETNCTLYGADFSDAYPPPSITYDMGGTRACELGNNDFGLHLCETVEVGNLRLRGTLEVLDDNNDNDMIGLVWGAQDSSHFYSLSWKAGTQTNFGCDIPGGITVKRVEAATFDDLVGGDVYCDIDTEQSEVLLGPADTTTDGWEEGESYTVTLDFTDSGTAVTVVRDGDKAEMASFNVTDTTFTSGYFGSTTLSQTDACVGPLYAECL